MQFIDALWDEYKIEGFVIGGMRAGGGVEIVVV